MPLRQVFRSLRALAGRREGAPRPAPDASARPYARWWWFSGPIEPEAIEAQLDWAAANGFGGVEIAWVYPLQYVVAGPRWLSPEWSDLVALAKRRAEARGLGCDFTFGTLWPFGGSFVPPEDSHHTFDGPSYDRLTQSWEAAHEDEPGLILDHLNRHALGRYARVMGQALAPALEGRTSALFCDSWEVPTRRMWSPALGDRFRERFGYDLLEHVDRLAEDAHLRYDYRAFVADAVLDEFYRPFAEVCTGLGAVSRVQCHGAPTDLIAAYACVDIPESEALLFNPPFSRIAASAAALAARPIVSCEAFTCLYGFPAEAIGREDPADLRLLADAVIAHGVNQIVWHGMPYNPPRGSNRFFASVHVGPDAAFAADLPALNAYLASACAWMRRGRTESRLAVYLPVEDARMRDRLPPELRSPAAQYHWEMRHEVMPEEAEGFAPLWISGAFLHEATWDGAKLRAGEAEFDALFLAGRWLESRTLDAVLRLAEAGLPVVLPRRPARPGRGEDATYADRVARLAGLPHVREDLADLGLEPLVEGEGLPPFWARRDGEALILFFAHPGARAVRYPMAPGQARDLPAMRQEVAIRSGGRRVPVALEFEAGRSVLVRVAGGAAEVVPLP